MNITVILAHPGQRSFNHAIAGAVVNILNRSKHNIFFHDLYREKFNPVLPDNEVEKFAILPAFVEKYCTEISSADGIVIVHPNWWGQPPAILKGWVDRILRPGVAYRFDESDSGEGIPVGLLKAETALIFNTSNTPEKRELSVFGDPLETLWRNCIFGLCGVKNIYRKNFGVVVTSTLKQRTDWLNEAAEITGRFFPPESNRK